MASAQDKLAQMEARQCYRNVWEVDLFHAPAADPRFCCFAFWCGPCVSYILRKRALRDDMSRYTCCAGYMPCSGRCGESKCPEFCLCTEVILCFNNSVSSTRFLLQDEFNIQTTPCDNCIIAFMVCVQQLACVFSLLGCILGCEEIQEAAHILRCIANLTFCTVCPCMQTQHKVEMDKRDGTLGDSAMAVPPFQQMSRLDQPYPPAPVGYPYGQHPGSYPAPGYPVANPPPPPYPHSHR